MTQPNETDRATVVPDAAPLRGESPEGEQPDPEDVLPVGEASETEHLVDRDDQG
ncbi:hypothetical protein [Actinomycetospora straminea]|uniref:Uncharacterized protein n=1 Tax=Actinomycetospora straminea TaxID=663607 RepID=A0ABP9EX02_9PSEU|nr:hypothetical protein [Actinomycetospora straminea]MDD7933556.1 hypothetical protein [Actinomycetospora straminea]